jgi:hypothetical protein
MAKADIVERVKDILYGTEIGEAPSVRVSAADAAESVAGSLVTFNLASGEGDKVKAGHVLSAVSDSDQTAAYQVYVTSVATDAVTGVNGYRDAPLIAGADSGDVDSTVWEQNPLVSDYKIHSAIDTIFATSLWPYVFKFATASHTPNLSTGQIDMAAADMELEHAWQIIGGADTPVPGYLKRNLHTTLSANQVLGNFEYWDGSTCYTTTIQKYVLGDEDEDVNGLIEIVSTGAAAICLGASVSETQLAKSSKDSQQRGSRDVATSLWRDFLTLRTNLSEGLSRERPDQILAVRG